MESNNIEILLRFFKPIVAPVPKPKTPELLPYTPETPSSESNSSIDSDIAMLDSRRSDTVDGTINETAPKAELELKPNAGPIDNKLENTGLDAFINQYTLEGAAEIFASIKKYPTKFLIKFLHSFEDQMKKTTDKSYYNLLADEVYKLQKQIDRQEEIYKNHFLNIIFNCPESIESKIEIQKKCLQEYLTFEQIVETVLKINNMSFFIRSRLELNNIIKEDNFVDDQLVPIIKKLKRENTWDIVEELLMEIEPQILKLNNCMGCSNPAEYAGYPCGHKCLCECCKFKLIEFKQSETPKCPICRQDIFELIKIYE